MCKPMEAPPTTCFITMDSLVPFCQMWAKMHGYAVSKAHLTVGKNYQAKGTKQSGQKTASTKTDCPFKLLGLISTSKKITNKFWTLKVRKGEHNHSPSLGTSSHTSHQRLLLEQVVEVGRLFKSNVKPAHVNKYCKDALGGKTPAKALMCVVKESNWEWEVKVNPSGAILNLFLHPPWIDSPSLNKPSYQLVQAPFVTCNQPGSIQLISFNWMKKITYGLLTSLKGLSGSLSEFLRFSLPIETPLYKMLLNKYSPTLKQTYALSTSTKISQQTARIGQAGCQTCEKYKATSGPLEAVHESLEACHLHKVTGALRGTIKGLIEINLDKPIRNLTISLSHETSSELKKIFDHINQIVAGTHVTVPINAPAKEELAKKRAAKGLRPQQKSKRVKKVEDVKDIPDLEQTEGDTDKGESRAYEPKEDLLDGIFTDSSDNEDSDGNKNEDRDEENNEEAAENEKPSNDEDQSTTKVQKEGGMIKEFLNNTQDTYISQLQHLLQPYIEGIFNPKGDGNCGFHCVAKALGYDNNGWSSVWHKMIKEITENKASYAKQQGGKQEAMMILEGLHVKTKKSKITLSEWLDKMAHGQVLADTYTRPVIFLSLIACNSFIHARGWVAFTKKGVALYKQWNKKKAP
ncbi:hypothetical protein PSHT_06542 [Puccinia striiformis]|uniref:OTU domain-containing protein n=1 Tax=Puccinia striiformis TaxID=27350 RepID=A0A2S4W5I8_9BASI|nr:hypothetical protein PSHT_06542 [Puccinia striiformis]